jgi:hypothetical protein
MAHQTLISVEKGYFKSLFSISTAPVPTVLITNIPTQMEPTVISKKRKVQVKNSAMYRPQKLLKLLKTA